MENLHDLSLRGPKGCGNLLCYKEKKLSLRLRLLRYARNDVLHTDVFYRELFTNFHSSFISIHYLLPTMNYTLIYLLHIIRTPRLNVH